MLYLLLLVTIIIYTVVLGFQKKNAKIQPKKYIIKVTVIALIFGLISGITIGTAHGHGVDFHWWLFSLIIIVLILFIPLILVIIMALIKFFQKS